LRRPAVTTYLQPDRTSLLRDALNDLTVPGIPQCDLEEAEQVRAKEVPPAL